MRRSAFRVHGSPLALSKDDDVFVGNEVNGEAVAALFPNEVALEEAAPRDQVVAGDAGEKGDTAFGGD